MKINTLEGLLLSRVKPCLSCKKGVEEFESALDEGMRGILFSMSRKQTYLIELKIDLSSANSIS